MQEKRNPFAPPAASSGTSSSEVPGVNADAFSQGNSKASWLASAAKCLVVLWVTVSPAIWWRNLSIEFNHQVPVESIVQPTAIALLALAGLPFLLRRNRRASIGIAIAAIAIACSVFVYPALFHDGVVINSVLLVVTAGLTCRSTGLPSAAR